VTEWRPSDDVPPSRYAGPPPAGPYDPNAADPPYPYGPGYGYPPPGYPAFGAFGYPPGEQRPGTVIAGAVLGYIAGGLLIFAGILLFTGASTLNDLDDTYGVADSYSTELTVMGLLNLVSAGLLIGGAVAMTGRSRTGRNLYAIGGAITLVLALYWLTRWGTKSGLEDVIVWALLFAALVVVGMSLACTGAASRWFATRAH
jgi:hypothetical protein